MKRFLFLAVLMSMFAIGNVSAQVISYSQTKVTKLEKERTPVELRQFAGAEVIACSKDYAAGSMFGAFYEIGAMFNNSIFVGGGFGVGNIPDSYDYDYIPTKEQCRPYGCDWWWSDDFVKGFTARVYANAKFYLTKTKLRPYFDLVVGTGTINLTYHNVMLADDDLSVISNEFKPWGYVWDFYVDPQVGLAYNIGRSVECVFVNVGYCVSISEQLIPAGLQFKLGITF